MSSKADFYIKREDSLEWQGSIMWNGNETAIPNSVLQSCSEIEFLEALTKFFNGRSDVVKPPNKWPWIWTSSKLTDYVYILIPDKGSVFISRYNSPAYTIYQFRDYLKRKKTAKKDGKSIIEFNEYVKKISTYTPKFPLMNQVI